MSVIHAALTYLHLIYTLHACSFHHFMADEHSEALPEDWYSAHEGISESGNGSVLGPASSSASTHAAGVLPEGWERAHDDFGRPYYFNRVARLVQWTIPEDTATDDFSDVGTASAYGPAGSAASTDVPNTAVDGGYRQRRVRRTPQVDAPPCGCNCQTERARFLGPRNRRTIRCKCPFCGHRPGDQGQGCHRRTIGDPTNGVWLCRECGSHCLALLILEEQSDVLSQA